MIRPDGASWSGVQDRFGERATGVDADGRSVDLLRLFEAFTPASRPLLDRITLLDVDRPAIGRAIALERDEESGRLILISEHVPGVRLSELLRTAVLRSVVADLGAALFVMRRLLMLAESLKAATGLAHFSIAPERTVITPHGRVVIVEPVLGAAAETDATGSDDIAAIAIAGMSIMLGHLIEDAGHIDPMSPVLQDAADVAAIRAGSTFSTALRLWFDRAVIADPALSFPDFRQARLALAHVVLARESGCDASRRALKVFLNDLAIERLTDVEASALESNRLREIRAKRLARWKAISAPDEEWIAVEHELLIGDEPRIVEEQFHGAVVDLDERADLDQRADEAIGIGPLAEPGMAAPGEESLEAAVVEEPIEAALVEEEPIAAAALVEWPIEVEPAEEPTEADPAPSSRSWFRSIASQLGLASAEPQPRETDLAAPPGDAPLESPLPELSTGTIADPAAADVEIAAWSSTVSAEPEVGEEQMEIGHAEPPVETIEEPFTEEAEPVAVDTLDQSPPMEPAIEAQGERPAEVAQDLTAFAAEEYESASIASESDAEPETLEQPARSLAEPVAAESWNAWTGGISEESIAPRVDDGPADAVQEEPARAVGAEVPSETIDAPLEEDEPVAPVDESIAAKLAEDAHRSWIQSITDQLGQMRRREEDLREPPVETTAAATDVTPLVDHLETESPGEPRETVDEIETRFAEDAAHTLAVEAAPIQPEWAAMEQVEDRTEQPAAWTTPAPEPWREDARAAGTVMPFPPEPVEEFLRAALAKEPTEADPAPASRSWFRSMARQLGLASAEPQPRETELTAPPGDVPLESPSPELSTGTFTDPAAADIEIAAWSSTLSAEPVPEEARIESGDAGEEEWAEEPAIEAQEERPAEVAQDLTAFAAEEYESAPIAAEYDAEPEPFEQPARSLAEPFAAESWSAWTERVSQETIAPRADDGDERPADAVEEEPTRVMAERTVETIDAPLEEDEPVVMPFPAKPVDHEYAPHQGVLHKRVADAQPHGPDAQPARWAPSPRTIVVPPRRWTRVAATILLAGLGLAFVAALAIAGRSYYRSATTPGTIAVDSTPSGSEVLVDGTPRGVTPLTLTLQPGDYVLALRRNGLTRQYPIAVKPRAQLSQHLDWSTVRATGTLAISSTPSQAKVTVDGKARGVTPLTLSDVPVGVRRIVIESSAGTVRREVRVVEGSQVTIDEAIIPGWIAAFAPFELQIYDGTRLLGAMEDGRIRVPPGRHELDFVNTRLGFRERRGIDVTPGMTTAVNIGAVAGIVRITAPAGADVLIDGVLFGDTPIRELRLPIGAHEIVLRHPQLGEQRVSVTVGASAPTEVTIDFTKR